MDLQLRHKNSRKKRKVVKRPNLIIVTSWLSSRLSNQLLRRPFDDNCDNDTDDDTAAKDNQGNDGLNDSGDDDSYDDW